MPLLRPQSVLLLLMLLVSGCASQRPGNIDAISSKPFQEITIGLCEDYPEETRSIEAAQQDLALLKTNDIRILRIAFGWDAMEPEKGKFDWNFWDHFVEMAVDDYGVTLIPYICYTPKWAASDQGENYWRAPPRDNADFARFMETIVNRYKDRIHSWELWNEPDNPAYWSGDVDQFAQLLKAGSEAVRKADPKAKVVSGGIAWNLDFLNQLFEKHNVSSFVDVINLHNYYETWAGDPIEKISDYINAAQRMVDEHGRNQPLWLAEVGYSDYRRGNFISEVYQARFDYEHTARYQAVSVGRVLCSALATEKVPVIAWYRIHDLPASEDIIGDVNNRHLGVLDKEGKPKPALAALVFFKRLFSGGIRCVDERIRVTRLLESDVEVHVFEKPGGELIVTAWLRAVSEQNERGPVDTRTETIDLNFLNGFAEKAAVYNELGDVTGVLPVRTERAGSRIEGLTLRGGEMKVLLLKPRVSVSVTPKDVVSFAE